MPESRTPIEHQLYLINVILLIKNTKHEPTKLTCKKADFLDLSSVLYFYARRFIFNDNPDKKMPSGKNERRPKITIFRLRPSFFMMSMCSHLATIVRRRQKFVFHIKNTGGGDF